MIKKEKKHRGILSLVGILCVGVLLGIAASVKPESWVNGTNYIYPNSNWSNNVNITGNTYLPSLTAGQVLCLKADGQIGNCTSIVGISGGCACG